MNPPTTATKITRLELVKKLVDMDDLYRGTCEQHALIYDPTIFDSVCFNTCSFHELALAEIRLNYKITSLLFMVGVLKVSLLWQEEEPDKGFVVPVISSGVHAPGCESYKVNNGSNADDYWNY
jgi:hypothetical protein